MRKDVLNYKGKYLDRKSFEALQLFMGSYRGLYNDIVESVNTPIRSSMYWNMLTYPAMNSKDSMIFELNIYIHYSPLLTERDAKMKIYKKNFIVEKPVRLFWQHQVSQIMGELMKLMYFGKEDMDFRVIARGDAIL